MIEITSTISLILVFILCAYISSVINILPHVNRSSINKRYYFFDGLRGIAAISVINAHIWRVSINGVRFENFDVFIKYNELLGSIGVQIFFCITGFLFTDQAIKRKSIFDWNKFFLARIKRLVPLYFSSMLLCILVVIYIGNGQLSSSDIYNSIRLFLFGFYGNGSDFKISGIKPDIVTASIWTLAYEWRFYFLMPVMCLILSSKIKNIMIAIVVLYIALTLYIDDFNIWIYFSTGAFTAYVFNTSTIKNKTLRIIIFLFGLTSCFFYFYLNHSTYDYVSFYSVSILFICIGISKPRFLGWKPLVYLGEISYSVYLNHLLVIVIVSFFIHKLNPRDFYNPILCYSIIAVSTFIISIVTYKYIEYPFIRKKAQ